MDDDEPVPLDHSEHRRWMATAERSLDVAEDLRRLDRHEAACFHAEQAAQQAMKAVLRGIGLSSVGHDLVDLGRRLADGVGGVLPDRTQRALQLLSRYYIPTRYPDAWTAGTPADHYGREDSEAALEDGRVVLGTARSIWAQLAPGGAGGDGD